MTAGCDFATAADIPLSSDEQLPVSSALDATKSTLLKAGTKYNVPRASEKFTETNLSANQIIPHLSVFFNRCRLL